VSCAAVGWRPGRAADANHRELAEHYAPVVFQESRSTVLDFITSFDYDGDWKGDNNWRNAYLFDLTGHVYYSVIESTSHYFITYAFYHRARLHRAAVRGLRAEDRARERHGGCTITIEKDGQRVRQSRCCSRRWRTTYSSSTRTATTAGCRPAASKIDGAMQFVDGRPADLCRGRRARREIAQSPADGVRATTFPASSTATRARRRCRQQPDPNATYDLEAIEDTLWARRFDVGSTFCCADSYAMNGGTTSSVGSALNGPIGGCAAKPPWGWDQADDKIAKGDWFRDPLKAYPTQLRIQNFTGTYVHNPYLESDGRNAGQPCAESTTSKTVNRARSRRRCSGSAAPSPTRGSRRPTSAARPSSCSSATTRCSNGRRRRSSSSGRGISRSRRSPSIVTQGLADEMRIPSLAGFSLTSPSFNAPTRYFDNIVLRYRTPLEGLRARVVWSYDQDGDFSDEFSMTAPICARRCAGDRADSAAGEPEVGRVEDDPAAQDAHRVGVGRRGGGVARRRAVVVGTVHDQLSRLRSRRLLGHVRTTSRASDVAVRRGPGAPEGLRPPLEPLLQAD
jgi:hypothetical protein